MGLAASTTVFVAAVAVVICAAVGAVTEAATVMVRPVALVVSVSVALTSVMAAVLVESTVPSVLTASTKALAWAMGSADAVFLAITAKMLPIVSVGLGAVTVAATGAAKMLVLAGRPKARLVLATAV